MTTTLTPRPLVEDARALAAWLREHQLPGARSMTAIERLRRERARRNAPAPVPVPVAVRARQAHLEEIRREIRRRGGEIVIEGEHRDYGLEIWDRDRERGLTLVGVEAWRHYSRRFGVRLARLAYLSGVDDAGRWAVRVPGTLRTVAEALAWLEPAEVTQARQAGRRVWRQGDVYAVETTPAHDGAGAAELPAAHRWNPRTRYLTHHPEDGRKHRPLRLPCPVRFVRQRALQMGRGAGWGGAD